MLPTVLDLADHFDVTPVTVRRAVQVLVAEGLVESSRGRRMTVKAGQPAQSRELRPPLELLPEDRITILSRDTVAADEVRFGQMGEPDGDYVRIEKVHSSEDGEPFALVTIFVARDLYRLLPEGADETQSITNMLMDKLHEMDALSRQVILVSPCDVRTASILQIAFADPVAHVRRVLIDQNNRLLIGIESAFRGDLFEMYAEERVTDMMLARKERFPRNWPKSRS